MQNNKTHTSLNIAKSNNSVPIWGHNFPTIGASAKLTDGVEQTYFVPDGVKVAIFRYTPGANVFVSTGLESIVVPIGPFVPSRYMLSPTSAYVTGGDTLRFISSGADVFVNINFFDNR